MQTIPLGTGKCSSFGGPNDVAGVGAQEGLGCIEPTDLSSYWFHRLFLQGNAYNSGLGLARNLNPASLYCAMRWGYTSFDGRQGEILPHRTREEIRHAIFLVESDNGFCFVQAADWGPSTDTGRLIDLSPGALAALKVGTDDVVLVSAIFAF